MASSSRYPKTTKKPKGGDEAKKTAAPAGSDPDGPGADQAVDNTDNEKKAARDRPAAFRKSRRSEFDSPRVSRLLQIAKAIREDPYQPLAELVEKLGIGRSQFYKDKAALEQVGFRFHYSKTRGFIIEVDKLTPITGLSVSDRIILMIALEQLCHGDGMLAAMALEAGKKLVGGLPEPFMGEMRASFESMVTSSLGVQPDIWTALRDAILSQKRVRVLYTRSGTWNERWRELDPRYIYMRDHTLYLYARTADETPPQWKVFRLSRVSKVENTGLSIQWRPGDDGDFAQKKLNAFGAFIGDVAKKVVVRFSGEAAHYVAERRWHPSETQERQPDGSLIYTVKVAEPMEVVRWARKFGDEAVVLDIESGEEPGTPGDEDDAE